MLTSVLCRNALQQQLLCQMSHERSRFTRSSTVLCNCVKLKFPDTGLFTVNTSYCSPMTRGIVLSSSDLEIVIHSFMSLWTVVIPLCHARKAYFHFQLILNGSEPEEAVSEMCHSLPIKGVSVKFYQCAVVNFHLI